MLICLTDISKTAEDLLRAAAGRVRGRSVCSMSERKKIQRHGFPCCRGWQHRWCKGNTSANLVLLWESGFAIALLIRFFVCLLAHLLCVQRRSRQHGTQLTVTTTRRPCSSLEEGRSCKAKSGWMDPACRLSPCRYNICWRSVQTSSIFHRSEISKR
jgi:hypothetical protein